MNKQAFWQGYAAACHARGINPQGLQKQAVMIGGYDIPEEALGALAGGGLGAGIGYGMGGGQGALIGGLGGAGIGGGGTALARYLGMFGGGEGGLIPPRMEVPDPQENQVIQAQLQMQQKKDEARAALASTSSAPESTSSAGAQPGKFSPNRIFHRGYHSEGARQGHERQQQIEETLADPNARMNAAKMQRQIEEALADPNARRNAAKNSPHNPEYF